MAKQRLSSPLVKNIFKWNYFYCTGALLAFFFWLFTLLLLYLLYYFKNSYKTGVTYSKYVPLRSKK